MKLVYSFVFLVVVTSTFPVASSPILFDLAADWSDASNPNGPWSYNGASGAPLTIHQAIYDTTLFHVFSGPQPAWADGPFTNPNIFDPGHVPLWAKSLGLTGSTQENIDFPNGRVGTHTSGSGTWNSVTWTSPFEAAVTVDGAVWLMRERNSIDWELYIDGTSVSTGQLVAGDPYSSAIPMDLALGSGGPGVLSFNLLAGDIVELQFTGTNGGGGEYVGVDLSIEATVIPEISSLIACQLAIASASAFGFWQRSRRRN